MVGGPLPAPCKGFQYLQSSGALHWAGEENWAASNTMPQTQLALSQPPVPPSALFFCASSCGVGCPHLPPSSAIASWIPQRLQGERLLSVCVRSQGIHFHNYF